MNIIKFATFTINSQIRSNWISPNQNWIHLSAFPKNSVTEKYFHTEDFNKAACPIIIKKESRVGCIRSNPRIFFEPGSWCTSCRKWRGRTGRLKGAFLQQAPADRAKIRPHASSLAALSHRLASNAMACHIVYSIGHESVCRQTESDEIHNEGEPESNQRKLQRDNLFQQNIFYRNFCSTHMEKGFSPDALAASRMAH